MKNVESIHPHVGDYYVYQGNYKIPEGFTYKIENDTIVVTQQHVFRIGEYVHSIVEKTNGDRMIVVGKISELIGGEEGLCMALSEYTQGFDFHSERIVVHKWFSKPADDGELFMYNEAKEMQGK